jgi:hypothetical protein
MWPAASFFGAEFVIAYLFLLTSPAMLVLPSFRDSMNPNRLSEDTFLGMLRDLVQCSLAHNTGLGGINSGAAVLNLLRNVIGLALVPAAVLAAAWMGWRGLRHDHDSAALPLCSALASTIVIGATAQALYVHYALDLIMPHERYALYLLPLAGLALVSAADFLQREAGPWRATGHLFFGAAVMVVLFYGCQLNWTHFLTWRYDADTKSFMQQVAARVGDHPTSPIVLGGSWYYEPTSNYYRITRQYTWMAPIYRGDSDAPYDFYILRAEDKDVVSRLGLEPIASGLVSGAVLAAQR